MNMNNNNQRNNHDERPKATSSTIPPPLPPFRSVRMNVGPAPVMVQPQSFGAKAPPMMPGASSFGVGNVNMHKAPPKPMGFAVPTNNSFSTNTSSTCTNQSSKFVWKVDSVQTVPVYHPLERTAVTFGSEHTLDMITERISNFMKEQSIFAEYDDSMARVVCATDCCLHFSVQLWNNKSRAVVMEMQRKQGCAIRMQSLRQQLKDCILFGEEQAKTQNESSCPPSLKQQLARMVPAIPSSQKQGSCMDLCQEMLSSNSVHHHRMGLESLCILTDASKVQDANEASEKVLQDSKLQMLLVNYLASQDQASLHLLTIKAVAQALESCSSISSNKIDLSSVFWQTALQALYQHIQRPHEKPLEAALSIKALRLLQAKCPECLQVLQRKHSLPVTAFLQIAHEFGKQHSSSLEQETKQFMMTAAAV